MKPKTDIQLAKNLLSDLPTIWDGKKSVLELKEANFNQNRPLVNAFLQ
ncbi:MAG: hypothetical protein HY781_03495 [Chloroflexi bacterium]|nr:hypothetical protein [Chloroflexota bacterium]